MAQCYANVVPAGTPCSDDGDPDTIDECNGATLCVHTVDCQLHGDVFPTDPPPGNCIVDLDDVIYVLAGFASANPCVTHPGANLLPCGQPCQSSPTDLDDALSVLAAFAGDYDCSHPDPP
jgi:hypothetical protein